MNWITIQTEHYKTMQTHVRANLPEEACGLLGGIGNQVQSLFLITNQAHSPVRYFMDPVEMVKAFHWLDEHGQELIATYHSHPVGPDHPSETDLVEFMYPGTAMLIWSPGHALRWQVKAFWIEDKKYREIKVRKGRSA